MAWMLRDKEATICSEPFAWFSFPPLSSLSLPLLVPVKLDPCSDLFKIVNRTSIPRLWPTLLIVFVWLVLTVIFYFYVTDSCER